MTVTVWRGQGVGDSVSTTELASDWVPSSQAGVADFDTVRQPSATRPVFVVAWCAITCDSVGDDGTVQLQIENANPPTVVHGEVTHADNSAAPSTFIRGIVCGWVPAGHRYRLLKVTGAGSPVFNFGGCREWVF